MNNSICLTCSKRYNCPAKSSDIVCDFFTGFVIQCDIYDYFHIVKEDKK